MSSDQMRGALDREWLLTNGLGGFAMGTACGARTRRYHGLLVAACAPPIDRIVALAALDDCITLPHAEPIGLATHLFGQASEPLKDGWRHLLDFRCDGQTVAWRWQLPTGITISRELSMVHGFNACRMRWRIDGLSDTAWLRITPLVAMRDFHTLLSEPVDDIVVKGQGRTLRVTRGEHQLVLRPQRNTWSVSPVWWEDFTFPVEQARGYNATGCALAAATIDVELTCGQPTFELTAELDAMVPPTSERRMGDASGVDSRLLVAADAFVATRMGGDVPSLTIMAGFPWFADWGRDAMISIPGLLLSTGRLDDAARVLETFARARHNGLIPNRFDDRVEGLAHYNTADASLWFLHAVATWIEAGGDGDVRGRLMTACMDIIDCHLRGVCHGVRVDESGLIEAGIEGEAFTWMDARIDGVAVTPRIGRPVELSALWISALRRLAAHCDDAAPLLDAAGRAEASFEAFWNSDLNCCYDVLPPADMDAQPDVSIRPNQIFAVSLPHAPLTGRRATQVVEMVRQELLTPYGLRTLSPDDPSYCGRFDGDMRSRDTAYHNGTVWPWLIGPWCDAVRATCGDPSADVTPLLDSLDHGCIGQIAEIYDGDAPHHAHGCPAQAWSVAELIRASEPRYRRPPTNMRLPAADESVQKGL